MEGQAPLWFCRKVEPGSWSLKTVEKLDGNQQYRVIGTCKHEVPGDGLSFEATLELTIDTHSGVAALKTVQTSPDQGKDTVGLGRLQLSEDGLTFDGVWFGHKGYEAKKEAK